MVKIPAALKYKEKRRRIYYFLCLGCAKNRITCKRKNLKNGLCRKCRKLQIPRSQIRLFGDPPTAAGIYVNGLPILQ